MPGLELQTLHIKVKRVRVGMCGGNPLTPDAKDIFVMCEPRRVQVTSSASKK